MATKSSAAGSSADRASPSNVVLMPPGESSRGRWTDPEKIADGSGPRRSSRRRAGDIERGSEAAIGQLQDARRRAITKSPASIVRCAEPEIGVQLAWHSTPERESQVTVSRSPTATHAADAAP